VEDNESSAEMMLTQPVHSASTLPREGVMSMPASINQQGYIRVSFPGFDRCLTSWRGQSVLKLPLEEKEKLCEFFNMAIVSGNLEAVKTWFPRERAKYLIKRIAWQWFNSKPKRTATISSQTYLLKKYILPRTGDKSAQEITRQDFYWIREAHGDTQMARDIRATCQAILTWAWREGMMDKQIYLPTIMVPKRPTPYIEFADRWHIHAKVDPRYQDPILLSIELGMRVGEIVALKWDAIDLPHNRIKLIRSLSKTKIEDMRKSGDEVWLNIDIAPKTRKMLEKRRKQLVSEWVFPAERGGFTWSNRVSKAFKAAAKACGLPQVRLHDCRHSCSIDWIEQGRSLEEVQARLGHRERRTTEGYIGLLGYRRMGKVVEMEEKDDILLIDASQTHNGRG